MKLILKFFFNLIRAGCNVVLALAAILWFIEADMYSFVALLGIMPLLAISVLDVFVAAFALEN